jgi:hypothetical protein
MRQLNGSKRKQRRLKDKIKAGVTVMVILLVIISMLLVELSYIFM